MSPTAVLKEAATDFVEDRVLTHAAALAFYTALSLPPLVVLLVRGLGRISDGAEAYVQKQAAVLVGPEGESFVEAVLSGNDGSLSFGGVSGWIAIPVLLFAASGVFSQLQEALNRAWNVRLQPSGVRGWLRKRFLSLGAVGVLAFLASMSLAASTAIEVFGRLEGDGVGMWVARIGVSVVLFSVLIAAVFRLLPDVEASWRDVLGGAAVTAVMFTITQYAVRFYLTRRDVAGDYGAVGTAIVVLLWVYLGAIVLLAGAELTQAWVHARGRELEPNQYAARVGD